MSNGSPAHVQVIVIDDNPADVYLIEEALRAHQIGFDMIRFDDGEAALKALCADVLELGVSIPDLIFLDLHMPRFGGLEVLKKIRDTGRLAQVPVAVLSASQCPEDRQVVATLGSSMFVAKPTDLDDFLREVGAAAKKLLGHAKDKQ